MRHFGLRLDFSTCWILFILLIIIIEGYYLLIFIFNIVIPLFNSTILSFIKIDMPLTASRLFLSYDF
jgi:hypothetical protein